MLQLKNFYSKEGIFTDKDNDEIYDGIKGKIYLRKNASIGEKLTALNLLARLSYECSAMSKDNIEYTNSFGDLAENSIAVIVDDSLKLNDDETRIYVEGKSLKIVSKKESALSINGRYLYGRMPYIWNVGKGNYRLEDIISLFETSGISGTEIDSITLCSKYQGVENICISLKSDISSELKEKLSNSLEASDKFNMVKTITAYFGNEEYQFANKNFKEITHDEIAGNNTLNCNHNNCSDNNQNDSTAQTQFQNQKQTQDKTIDLADLFSIDGIYSDSENDMMNNRMDVVIKVDENISDTMVKAVGNIAARVSLDCLELKLDLVKTNQSASDKNVIEIIQSGDENAKIYLAKDDKQKNKIVIEGSENSVLKLSEIIAEQYPYIDSEKTVQIKDLKDFIQKILKGRNYQGQILALENVLENEKNAKEFTLYANLAGQEKVEEVQKIIADKYPDKKIQIKNYKQEETVWTDVYEPEWEVDIFEEVMRNEVYPKLKAGDKVEIRGCLSEEKCVRDDLNLRINKEIQKHSANLESSHIFSTYKQGFSWITEKVIPELKELNRNCQKKTDKVIIKFKPFLPEGMKEWLDENGATPSYSQTLGDDANKWLDLPIRFLQELYPVDDIIAGELGINRDNIIFKADDSLNETYEITCFSNEKEIYKDTGSTRVSERPYLDEFPEQGKVHPTTGWITVLVNGAKIVDKQIKTDLENIWDYYQHTALNKAKEYILENNDGKILIEKQPFFKELRIEAEISDLDYKLPTRKDLISSLDALHEDIYFVGSDFFKYLGIKMAGKPAAEPGLVLPILRKRNGRGPKLTASIKKEIYDGPRLFVDGREIKIYQSEAKNVEISYIGCNDKNNENLEINIKLNSVDYKSLSKYQELAEKKAVKDMTADSLFSISFEDEISGQKSTINGTNNKPKTLKKPLDSTKINTENLIGYDDYIKLMEELKDVKNIKSYISAESYQGRDVYTVEMLDEELNDMVSRPKLINLKPVCLINSRHHANEISSTNAAFELIKHLLTDDSYKHYLQKLNIVVIPFENPDGGYIHYELQKDNPEWKTHVARFDSMGKDITSEWFNFDTIHTEALAYTKTWFKWLPDVITDNHGVPSHEWDQQFSGYVSPSFKGFWLPRALYYGYFWYITNEEYTKNNVGVCKLIQDKLSDYLNADKEMTKWNLDWANRFEKYAHEWMPKLFPADYYKNLIYYWIPFDVNKVKKYSSHRYPNITSVDWTTEVSDETATGDYLGLCAGAHIKGCLAAMDSVISLDNKAEVKDYENNGQIILNKKRNRPLYL